MSTPEQQQYDLRWKRNNPLPSQWRLNLSNEEVAYVSAEYNKAAKDATDAAFGGYRHDGGASDRLDAIRFWLYGKGGHIPPTWKKDHKSTVEQVPPS